MHDRCSEQIHAIEAVAIAVNFEGIGDRRCGEVLHDTLKPQRPGASKRRLERSGHKKAPTLSSGGFIK